MSNKQKIIYIYFILLPFIDVITSLIVRFTDFTISLGMIIKGTAMILSIIYIFVWSKSKYKKISIKYIFTIFLFAIIYFATKGDILKISLIKNELVYAFRYLYFPIMFVALLNIFDDFEIDSSLIKKILFINCLSYTILLLIPYITNTGFDSYRYSSVFGKNGWFYAANETGIIAIILLTSINQLFDNNKKWKILVALPILISISLIGTKVSFFGMIIVVILIVLKNIIEKKKSGILLSVLLVILLII